MFQRDTEVNFPLPKYNPYCLILVITVGLFAAAWAGGRVVAAGRGPVTLDTGLTASTQAGHFLSSAARSILHCWLLEFSLALV